MDDYIYILLGVAWIIYAFYRAFKRQAQKKATESAGSKEAPGRDFKGIASMLDRLALDEEETGSYENKSETEEMIGATLQSSSGIPGIYPGQSIYNRSWESLETMDTLETIPEKEGANDYYDPRFRDQEPPLKKNKKRPEQIREALMDFDLRKAVIYSTILERPYK